MHQNNGTVFDHTAIILHNGFVVKIHILILPVKGIQGPHEERFPNRIHNVLVGISVRCSHHSRCLSAGIDQRLVRIVKFLHHTVKAQLIHIGMIPGMVADLTAKLQHSLHIILIVLNILAKHEEGCMCIVLFQAVQKLRGILSRAIIKCQGNHRTLLRSIVGTIVVKVIVL